MATTGMEVCPSCGAQAARPYCGECGQRLRRARLTVRGVLHAAAADTLNMERGLLHTVVELTRDPARVLRGFLGGRTRPYMGPAKYFLLWVTVAQILALQFGMVAGFAEGFTDVRGGMAADEVAGLVNDYFVLLLAAELPLVAVAARWLFRRSGLNLAEQLVVHFYVGGHQMLIFCVLVAPLELIGAKVLSLAALALLVGYYYRVALALFGGRVWSTLLRITLVGILGFLGSAAVFAAVLAVARSLG